MATRRAGHALARPQRQAQGGRALHRRPRQLHRRHQRCPGCCTWRSCAARSRTPASTRSTRRAPRRIPGVVAVVTGELLAAAQPRLDADALRRHAGRARDRQGAHAGPGGRLRDRRGRLHRARRARADRGRLRAAPGGHDAAAGARGRRVGDPRRQGGPGRQPRLPLGGRRRRGDRARVRGGRPGRQPRHASTRAAIRRRSSAAAASPTSTRRPARRRST